MVIHRRERKLVMLNHLFMRALGTIVPAIATAVICAVSAVIGVTPAFGELSRSLSLEITADKKQFLLGEPVWVDVVLKNVSQDTVRIPHFEMAPELSNLDFFVVCESETLQYTGGVASYWIKPRDLAPAEGLTSQEDILDYYGKPREGTGWFEKVLDPGTYSVQASAWHSVMSDTLEVEVIEPSGEELEIYNGLHEAILLRAQRRFQEAAERLCSLLPSASRSAYRDKLYFWLIRIVHNDKRRQRRLSAQILREYPDSRYARFCLSYVIHGMSRAEAEKFVGELESTAPGTRAAVQGRKMLETYEFRK
jgi:hypothetical protein